mgnify:CR=1 FL=1
MSSQTLMPTETSTVQSDCKRLTYSKVLRATRSRSRSLPRCWPKKLIISKRLALPFACSGCEGQQFGAHRRDDSAAKGKSRADATPNDVDPEFITLFNIFDELQSAYLPRPTTVDNWKVSTFC